MIINEEFYYHPPQMPTANQEHPSSFIIYRTTRSPHLSQPLPAESPLAWRLQATILSHIWFPPHSPPPTPSNRMCNSGSTLEVHCLPEFFSLCIVALSQKHALVSKPLKHPPDSLPVSISPGCQCWFPSKVHFYNSKPNIFPRFCANIILNTVLYLSLCQLLIPQWYGIILCILWIYFITLVNKKALAYGRAEYT